MSLALFLNYARCLLFDHPAAIAKMREHIGNRRLHVICHCLGSLSFIMSLFGKATSGITSVISNAVSLTPSVPKLARIKLTFAPFLLEHLLGISYANPLWHQDPGLTFGKIMSKIVSLSHQECNVPACNMESFLWGIGHPVFYCHENRHEITHKRCGDLQGGTGMNYYRHLRKMLEKNCTVKYQPDNPKYARLPNNYFEYAQDIQTPVLFTTGDKNRVLPNSNVLSYKKLENVVPGKHEIHVFPNYGHIDIFMGKNSHLDIFPRLLEFLNKHKN